MREMVRWKFRNCFQSQVSQRLKQANTCSQVWDEELARVSQRWADQCMPGHDQRRNVGSDSDADDDDDVKWADQCTPVYAWA